MGEEWGGVVGSVATACGVKVFAKPACMLVFFTCMCLYKHV